jgi:hypothetical protein
LPSSFATSGSDFLNGQLTPKLLHAEAEALRKATLALTEDLHMDSVLDALLCSLAELVPYTCARVLVPEGGPHWLALGEKSFLEPAKKISSLSVNIRRR